MHVILILLAGLTGAAMLGWAGCILGGLIGYLVAELLALKKRILLLEQKQVTEVVAAPEKIATSEEVRFTPIQEVSKTDHPVVAPHVTSQTAAAFQKESVPSQKNKEIPPTQPPSPSWLDGFFQSLGNAGSNSSQTVRRFFTGGNLMLKMGLIILFFGVAFLVKYAAQRDLVPIEFRLVATAIGALVMLGLGWRLRGREHGYGLGLQGGGVGILYLVVFGSAKLYTLLPMPVAFAVMVGLVAVSGALAVLQDSKMLAVFGIVGGFLAPVLMSTGSGSHVMLFSYFAVLNAGILGIAWYKSWRELNLIGFFFTFGIGTLWGSQGYQPHFFTSTEPFLILFFLFYVTISVLFAHKQPVQLKGFIDGPLVFGLPLVVSGLQYSLVKDFEYGIAISAFSFGFFYLLLATLLWRRLAEGMRLLCEAFMALGVVFASLTIPLALDNNWTTAAWAIEGAAMVWVGVRQNRQLARIFAILLQLGAAWTFVESSFYPFVSTPFANSYFFGCIFISFAALFSGYYLDTHRQNLREWEQKLPVPLLIWGLGWWYHGGLRESERHFRVLKEHNAILLFSCASTMLMSIVARKAEWRNLAVAQLILLPMMVLSALFGILDFTYDSHLLAGWGLLVWAIAFFSQYRMLHQFDSLWPERLAGYWHIATLWLLLFILCLEASWLTDIKLVLNATWEIISWGILPAAAIFMLINWSSKVRWPFAAWQKYYNGPAILVPACLLVVWSIFVLQEAGDPGAIRYIPVINPLELSVLFVTFVLLEWALACKKSVCHLPRFIPVQAIFWLAAGLAFLWLNSVVGRGVHFYCGIPYYFVSLYHSVVFQAAIAALWSLTALTVTVLAARSGNRIVWCCGAVLLGLVVAKLFLIDLSGTGTVARIVSFLSVGILMLVIGYFSPMPPSEKEERA
jgi:uncharacterized membrane protein